jgi:peptidoglycan hydrolase-like protein with peptidoglycan-binding domain
MKAAVIALVAFVSVVAITPSNAQSVSVSQLDVNAVPRLSADGVRRVQTLLRQRGFDSGPLDGVAGPITKSAIRSFQEKYGMNASGEIDNQFLLGIGAVELAGGSE